MIVHFACRSHNAESRISASFIFDLELEYMNRLQWFGWNSVAVMTSVSSSILTGLMSTISVGTADQYAGVRETVDRGEGNVLKL